MPNGLDWNSDCPVLGETGHTASFYYTTGVCKACQHPNAYGVQTPIPASLTGQGF
jgi:hypothetical protein